MRYIPFGNCRTVASSSVISCELLEWAAIFKTLCLFCRVGALCCQTALNSTLPRFLSPVSVSLLSSNWMALCMLWKIDEQPDCRVNKCWNNTLLNENPRSECQFPWTGSDVECRKENITIFFILCSASTTLVVGRFDFWEAPFTRGRTLHFTMRDACATHSVLHPAELVYSYPEIFEEKKSTMGSLNDLAERRNNNEGKEISISNTEVNERDRK